LSPPAKDPWRQGQLFWQLCHAIVARSQNGSRAGCAGCHSSIVVGRPTFRATTSPPPTNLGGAKTCRRQLCVRSVQRCPALFVWCSLRMVRLPLSSPTFRKFLSAVPSAFAACATNTVRNCTPWDNEPLLTQSAFLFRRV